LLGVVLLSFSNLKLGVVNDVAHGNKLSGDEFNFGLEELDLRLARADAGVGLLSEATQNTLHLLEFFLLLLHLVVRLVSLVHLVHILNILVQVGSVFT
jgi:hypothetical protein